MTRSRYFVLTLALLGLLFVAPVSCIFSPEDRAETKKETEADEQEIVPASQAIICNSSEELFTKVMRSDTTLVLVAEPVSDEEAPEIYYQYTLYDANENVVREGYLRVVNPRLEEELQAEDESLGWGLPKPQIRLFTWACCMGSDMTYKSSQRDLGDWKNKFLSCYARLSAWILYSKTNYRGVLMLVRGVNKHLGYMCYNTESIKKVSITSGTRSDTNPYNPYGG
jgi:hypothetical protein